MATRGPVQPYVLAGGAVPWLTVTDGSFLDDRVGDARFRGWGVDAEAGVTVYPHPRVGVGVGYAYPDHVVRSGVGRDRYALLSAAALS